MWPIVGWQEQSYYLRMEGRVVLQDIISDVRQLELAYVPVKGWIIDPEVHGILDGPDNTVCLPTHYGETVHSDVMTSGVSMVIDWGQGP